MRQVVLACVLAMLVSPVSAQMYSSDAKAVMVFSDRDSPLEFPMSDVQRFHEGMQGHFLKVLANASSSTVLERSRNAKEGGLFDWSCGVVTKFTIFFDDSGKQTLLVTCDYGGNNFNVTPSAALGTIIVLPCAYGAEPTGECSDP